MLFIGPKVYRFKGFLRVIKIYSTTSFGREVKPGPHVVHLQGVKEIISHVKK
jgi:hypothetical protein